MAISEPDIKRLWGKAAGLCSHPDCNTDCLPFLDLDAPTVVGEMAHVIAKKENGPRGRTGGGDDTYANLILLCPTHHTLVDKAPEATFPEAMLLQWKTDHEGAIERSLASPLFPDRAGLAAYIQRLLIENHTCWATYGPESKEATRNSNSTAGRIWQFRKLSFIVPNNRRIILAIHANKQHFAPAEYALACQFVEHAEGFESNCTKPVEGVPRFPAGFGELFENERFE
jgi:HNH endonuclease